ncbi:carotenoid oxygenase family protein [Leptothoe spongobia]|uniref:Carotenoid oxygenase family protein n=1 Tax=Leptothoe spongobia TAU-MAC 1115 TaxID=1967444 RepID=A0A947DJ39_9CYAN|nr:carotenoid oxygenase family protein [Leptothoe spongobia]MBT9317613.1 carotenoid oxygenase family protein [Leptothoe spongobia TAU-MAC 1115]
MPAPTRDRNAFSQGKPLWSRAIATPTVEFGPTPLTVLVGQVPTDLRGSLYRNGPGRLQRAGETVDHWFDGDGGILAIHFAAGGATGLYRYVQTQGLQAEVAANRYLYPGYGKPASGPFWKRLSAKPKNVANTSVFALPDKLLALWEADNPHALDLETLETLGLDDLGILQPRQPYSAHPKWDTQTGDLYNFGVVLGRRNYIQLYRSDATGQIRQQGQLPLSRTSLVHDFVLAGPYLIFLIPPVVLSLLPILLQNKGFSDAMQWQPQHGTQVIVVDRHTLEEVSRFETDPWFQWHFGNGYQVADGTVVIDYVRYDNFDTNQWLKEFVTGYPKTPVSARLYRLRIDAAVGKVLSNEPQLDQECEFPIVAPQDVGQYHNSLFYCYKSQPKNEEYFDSIGCLQPDSGRTSQLTFANGCYPIEPTYVPGPQGTDWILTVVFDGNQDQSTLQILPADNLEAGPICILALPEIIPFGFHGTWKTK